MKKKILENVSLWKIILIALAIYIVVFLTSYISDKTNIFIGALIPVVALIIYWVCEYILRKKR